MNDDLKKIAGAFFIGGALGALIALLYAPQSGKETRRDIVRTARKIKRETAHVVEDAIDTINEFADGVKEKVSEIIEHGKELSDTAKKEIIKNLEHGQKVIEKQKKKIIDALGF